MKDLRGVGFGIRKAAICHEVKTVVVSQEKRHFIETRDGRPRSATPTLAILRTYMYMYTYMIKMIVFDINIPDRSAATKYSVFLFLSTCSPIHTNIGISSKIPLTH